MRLQALILSAEPMVSPLAHDVIAGAPGQAIPDTACIFCGALSGQWQQLCGIDDAMLGRSIAACPLCALARHLVRPRIDEEAIVIWLPEMSQQAINTIVREIHMQRRALGEDLPAARYRVNTPDRRALYHAHAALAARSDAAASRLGTDRASDLGAALLRLSDAAYNRRDVLAGGLRLLPMGRFFVGNEDVYPQIVDTWLDLAQPRSKAVRNASSDKGRTA
jgi:hypothetical protein